MKFRCPGCSKWCEVNLSPGVATEPSPYNKNKTVKVTAIPEHFSGELVKTWMKVYGEEHQRMVDVRVKCTYSNAEILFI